MHRVHVIFNLLLWIILIVSEAFNIPLATPLYLSVYRHFYFYFEILNVIFLEQIKQKKGLVLNWTTRRRQQDLPHLFSFYPPLVPNTFSVLPTNSMEYHQHSLALFSPLFFITLPLSNRMIMIMTSGIRDRRSSSRSWNSSNPTTHHKYELH